MKVIGSIDTEIVLIADKIPIRTDKRQWIICIHNVCMVKMAF